MTLLKMHSFGEGDVPLLIVHGLFGSARNWTGIAKALADTRHVVTVDLRNHGESFRDLDQSYAAMAGDLADVIDALGGPVDLLGHSMGGKAAMTLALDTPDSLRKLIVADIAPTSYTHSQAGLVHAMQSLDLTQVSRRSQADRALQDVIPHTPTRLFLLQSLVFENGVPEWRLNLDVLADQMPEIMSFPKHAGAYGAACLFLIGANSDYVTPAHHNEIKRLFPAAQFQAIAGAGHWLHAEQPQPFVAAVTDFLR